MDGLNLLSSVTSGLDSFGEAMQYGGLAQANDSQAGLLDVQAQGVIANSEFSARRMREQGDRVLAVQRARFAKSGVTFEGSPVETMMDSERNLRLDILVTKLNATNKANALGFEALQNRIAAGQARTRQVMAIGKSILQIGTGLAMQGGGDMGGGGTSQYGNKYGSNTPKGTRDMGTYSKIGRG